jgi:hypothetical protein
MLGLAEVNDQYVFVFSLRAGGYAQVGSFLSLRVVLVSIHIPVGAYARKRSLR